MIQEIGCSNDGSVWMSLLIEINNEQLTAIIPMTADKAKEVRGALDIAIARGQKWLETGVSPDEHDSPRIDKSSAKSDKRDSDG